MPCLVASSSNNIIIDSIKSTKTLCISQTPLLHITAHNNKGVVDSGCSGHYLPPTHTSILHDVVALQSNNEHAITLPDGSRITASHSGYLHPRAGLPKEALRAYIFPGLELPLISVPLLCDYGCRAEFSDACVTVTAANGDTVFTGSRHDRSLSPALQRLWTWDFGTDSPSALSSVALNVVTHDSVAELVAFDHAALGSPAIPTFLQAVERNYVVLPRTSQTRWPLQSAISSKLAKGCARHLLEPPPTPTPTTISPRHSQRLLFPQTRPHWFCRTIGFA